MGKIAFVFSGQGAQYSGMGRELYETSAAAQTVFNRADAIRPGTSRQCFGGSEAELTQTSNTQPCMFAVELAAANALLEAGVQPDMVAGFSLGEIAALTFAQVLPFDEGFELVCSRGELMQRAAEHADSGMVAVLKLDPDTVGELCARFSNVYPVNYNCPGQVSVAGAREELEPFKQAVREAGGKAVPLKVAGAFHSPFMAEAAAGLDDVLEGLEMAEPAVTLFSDYTAQPYAGDYRTLVREQVVNPVRWQSIIENMIADGADTFVEVGPGKTLCGLIGKISKDVRTLHVEDAESLAQTLEALGCTAGVRRYA